MVQIPLLARISFKNGTQIAGARGALHNAKSVSQNDQDAPTPLCKIWPKRRRLHKMGDGLIDWALADGSAKSGRAEPGENNADRPR